MTRYHTVKFKNPDFGFKVDVRMPTDKTRIRYVSPSMKIPQPPIDFSAVRAELMKVYEFMFVPESEAVRYKKAIEDVLIALQDYERDFQKVHICRKSPFETFAGTGEVDRICND